MGWSPLTTFIHPRLLHTGFFKCSYKVALAGFVPYKQINKRDSFLYAVGRLFVDQNPKDMEKLKKDEFMRDVRRGGTWKPSECIAFKVC